MSQPNPKSEIMERVEELKQEFQVIINREVVDWGRINEIGIELEELGQPEVEVELWQDVDSELQKDYKFWDKTLNGDTTTQML